MAPSYHQSFPLPNPATAQIQNQDATIASAGGNFFEIPFGIGGAWRARSPLEFIVELSGRAGLGFSGSYYDPNGRVGASALTNPIVVSRVGNDVFGLFLTAGLGIDL